MARKVSVILTDDLSTDETRADETVTFALDGTAYEIDLSDKNAKSMRDQFGRYVQAARRAGRQPSARRASGGGRVGADRERTREIRSWAEAAGLIPVGRKGRIPSAIIEQWENRAQPAKPAPAPKPEPSEQGKVNGTRPEAPVKVQGNTPAATKPAPPVASAYQAPKPA